MDRYAVFGNPIQHSLSPVIHQLFAAQTQQAIRYTAVLVAKDGFQEALAQFQAQGGKGLNVTLPFKQDAVKCCDQLSDRAKQAQAVNTITLQSDGKFAGDNTDGVGFIRDLTQHLQIPIRNQRILILGAGGAIRGILAPLLAENPSRVLLANRTLNTAQELVSHFSRLGSLEAITLSELNDEAFDVIINGISANLKGEEMPALNPAILHKNTFCYDLVYGKTLTPFLLWAKTQGVTHYSDGLGMLVEQAAEAFYIWRGIRPVTRSVIQQLRTHHLS